ncbi:MAG: hypothetical protein WCI81_08025 [Chlorobiaceae bacterium]
MFIKKDILEFFDAMMKLEEQQSDFFGSLSTDVEDSKIKDALKRLSDHEQRHMGRVQRIIDLVNSVTDQDLEKQT